MSSLPKNRWIEIEDVGDVAIVNFVKQILEAHDYNELGDAPFGVVDELGRRNVSLDFANTESVPSGALGKFITLLRKVRDAQGKLVLCNLSIRLREPFHTLKLDRIFTISPSLGHLGRAEILRAHFGVTFRPTPFAPEWRTGTAVLLAQQMFDARDFSAMPILAEALQDAGCDNDDVLDHCRGQPRCRPAGGLGSPGGLHARGCWVVDLVLGRA